MSFSLREEEDEFGDRKSFGPVINVVNIGEDIASNRVEERGQFATNSFWALAEDNSSFKQLFENEWEAR